MSPFERGTTRDRAAKRQLLVVMCGALVLILAPGDRSKAEPRRAEAQQDSDLRDAVDIYGEFAAAIAIGEQCPDRLSSDEKQFAREYAARFAGHVHSLSGRYGIPQDETSGRIAALGTHNADQVRSEITANGCSTARIDRTVRNVERSYARRAR